MTRKRLFKILLILSVFATFLKIFIGADNDENYAVVLGARIIQGDSFFGEIWDIHQTSALVMAVILRLYRTLFHTYDGCLIFTRSIAAIFQWLVGILFYKSTRKYYQNADFGMLLVVNMLPKHILNFDFSFLTVFFSILSFTLLFISSKNQYTKTGEFNRKIYFIIVLSAICYSLSVLAYPTTVVGAFVPLLYFFKKIKSARDRKLWIEEMLVYVASIGICTMVFIALVVKNVSVSEVFDNILNGMLADGSHETGNLLLNLFNNMITIPKEKIFQGGVLVLLSFVTYLVCGRFGVSVGFTIPLILFSSLAILMLNILNIRPSGPFGLQIRYILIVIAGSIEYFIRLSKNTKDVELYILFLMGGIGVYLGTMIGSNLSIDAGASFLILPIIAIVLAIGETDHQKAWLHWFVVSSLALFVISTVFIKGILVRVTGTSPANIFESREQVNYGPCKGVFVYPKDRSYYDEASKQLENMFGSDENVLFMTKDSILCMYDIDLHFTAPTVISTPVYNDEWIYYYKKFEEPTTIAIDKKYYNYEDKEMKNNSFWHFLEEKYQTLMETDGFLLLRKNKTID